MTGTDEFLGRAMKVAAYVRDVWVEAGRPLTQESTNGLLGRHPLWQVMVEAETHAMRFRAELGLSPRSAKAAIHRGPGRPRRRLRLRSVH